MLPDPADAPDFDPNSPADSCLAMRHVLDRIGDRWSMVAVVTLHGKSMRFNALQRNMEGISQRMLTLTLRKLERDGLIARTVLPGTPAGVEYALTQLGESLHKAATALLAWAGEHRQELEDARTSYDATAPHSLSQSPETPAL